MMEADKVIRELKRYNLGPYIGVPCSILAPMFAELGSDSAIDLINPASEAIAMGIACGSYMGSGRIPVLLMQNSGLCNALNAITSLTGIYKIPVLFIVSWRGEPGIKDAPEHDIIGRKTRDLLWMFGIRHKVITEKGFVREIRGAFNAARRSHKPYALLLREGACSSSISHCKPTGIPCSIAGIDAIRLIIEACGNKAYFVTSNGFISRDAFHVIDRKGRSKYSCPTFYMLGSMGHALPIGIGIARNICAGRKIVVLDGDGSCLMHVGAMASIGAEEPDNIIHIVLDNGKYASTGGQPTVSRHIDICKIASACGYKRVYRFDDAASLMKGFRLLLKEKGPAFVHLLVGGAGGRAKRRISDIYSCEEIKDNFMACIDTEVDIE